MVFLWKSVNVYNFAMAIDSLSVLQFYVSQIRKVAWQLMTLKVRAKCIQIVETVFLCLNNTLLFETPKGLFGKSVFVYKLIVAVE